MGIGSFIQGRFNDKTQKVRCMLDGKVQILPAQDVGKKRAGKDISCTAGPKGEFWYFILFREKLTVRLTGNGNMAAVRRNTRNDDCFGSQRKELIAQGFEFLIRRGLRLIGCIRKETGFGVIGRNECWETSFFMEAAMVSSKTR